MKSYDHPDLHVYTPIRPWYVTKRAHTTFLSPLKLDPNRLETYLRNLARSKIVSTLKRLTHCPRARTSRLYSVSIDKGTLRTFTKPTWEKGIELLLVIIVNVVQDQTN